MCNPLPASDSKPYSTYLTPVVTTGTDPKSDAAVTVKSIEQMTAREYTSTLTLSDISLQDKDSFWFRNAVRKACRFFPTEPHKHLYISLERWSKNISSLVYVQNSSVSDAYVSDDPTAMKFLSSEEFETTVNRLATNLLTKLGNVYSVNFTKEDMTRACERRTNPYRPEGLPEYTWEIPKTYYVEDPDQV
jgi:hypothetical protein